MMVENQLWTMWNWNSVLVENRAADALIENFACRTGISFTQMISKADLENMADLIMERYVTDLCYHGNDVTVLCSSSVLKYALADCDRHIAATKEEALVRAVSLQRRNSRIFFLMLIIESRVGRDRRNDSKVYSATSEKQVHDAQLFISFADDCATSTQPGTLQHRKQHLYGGFNEALFRFTMVLLLVGWTSIWTLWQYCLLQSIYCSFSISVKETCSCNSWISQARLFSSCRIADEGPTI